MTTPTGNDKNLALESFLLHFRNLRAFLCPSIQRVSSDDILASDYLGEPDPRDIGDPSKLGFEKMRLDKMLAHLSYKRPQYITDGNFTWPSALMTKMIIEDLMKFVDLLPNPSKNWFPSSRVLSGYRAQADTLLSGSQAHTLSEGRYLAHYPGR